MNKSICLLVLALLITFAACTPVEYNNQSYTMNIITLFYVQSQMLRCILGSMAGVFWGDNGWYFRRCFSQFIASPVFY